jgi:hypothetical protein
MKFIKTATFALLALLVAFPIYAADTVDLPPGYRLTVTADANTSGSFWRLVDPNNASQGAPTAVTAGTSGTAGPYQVNSTWAMDETLGKLTYTLTPVYYTDSETIDGINGAELLQRGTSSTTKVTNLNADLFDDLNSTAYGQLAVAAEWTKQQTFDAGTLTALGSELVNNGAFTDGDELVADGDMSADTNWTLGDGWSIAAGVADSDGTQAGDSDLTQTPLVALVNGEVYSLVFTAANRTAGNVTGVVGETEGTDRATNNTFTELITAAAGTDIDIRADVDFDGDVDDVSLKQVGDAGWTQGDGWLISTGSASSDGTQSADADMEHTGQVSATVAGNVYQVVFTVSNYSAGNVVGVIGNQEGTDRAANGTFTELITASNTDNLKIRADASFVGTVDTISVKSANVAWDLDDNQVATLTLDQNMVVDDPTNMKDGGIYYLHVKQDGTGSRLITWGSAFLWAGGTAPTLTTTATTGHDMFRFVSDGSSMIGDAGILDIQ